MAKLVLTDVNVSVNGTALGSSIAQVELAVESDDVETTSFGGNGWRTRVGGLKQANVTLSFMQDYAAGAVDATLWPLLNTIATVVVLPNGSAVGATNPSYTFTALVNSISPVNGAVGDLATFDVTWPVTGSVTRATA